MFDIKRILVPVDFADCSKRGLELALELAAKYNATVEVLHVSVALPYMAPSVAVSLGAMRMEELEELGRREAENQVAGLIEKVEKPAGVGIKSRVVLGLPHEVIMACAKDADLLVMGTHGRRGLAHMFVGSVTEKVVRECAKPVLVVHANEARS